MSQAPVDITPANKSQMIWTADDKGASLDKFEADYSMKPVSVKGIFDHTREVKVKKTRNGETGFDIVTPFYTHLDAKGKEQAILVNRGWIPADFKDMRMHYATSSIGSISGVLYRGDNQSKYSKPNTPSQHMMHTVRPDEIALLAQTPNEEEAGQFMLHMIDFDEDKRQVHPTVPTPRELTQFTISPERHAAYEMLWRGICFGGVLANTALWLYF